MSQHVFSQVPKAEIPRSRFRRDHEHKTTLDSGFLVPILIDEVLPGDTFNCRVSLFARLATLISPIMDNLFMHTYFFFIPQRLVHEHFQRMLGEQDNPDDSTDFLFPTLKAPAGGFEVGSLADYFGLPTGVDNLEVRAEPFRCYNLVFNEWFRDENLQDSLPFTRGDTDDVTNYKLMRKAKPHDYFTSALPWPQKGPGVELPIGGRAPVLGTGEITGTVSMYNADKGALDINLYDPRNQFEERSNMGAMLDAGYGSFAPLGAAVTSGSFDPATAFANVSGIFSNNGTIGVSSINGLYADLSSAGAVTINAFREAFQVQRWYERAARGGTRYTEILRSFFGVQSPDARLQRPEYLGGGSSRIDVNVVPQTSATDATTPQANLSAFAVGTNRSGDGFTKSFVEHGWILGLVHVGAPLTYQQGINRMWSRRTKFDLYWPTFSHLGEQAVLNKEIYAQGNEQDDKVFGYQERYAEYRYYPSMITGKFRSTFAQTLDNWHLAQKFDNLPTLSDEFIQDRPPVDRIISVPSEPQIMLDCYFNMSCVRPMPLYGVPGLVDHF